MAAPVQGRRSRALKLGSVILTCCLALGFAHVAAATTVRPFDLEGLVDASSDIVVGRVEEVKSRWDRTHTNIVTEVTLAVAERLKGANSSRITVYQLGGEVGDVRVEVEGCPTFRRGEEAVYFLARDRAGHTLLTGLAQGRYEIERDPEGRALVRKKPLGMRPIPTIAGESQSRPGFALEAFLDQVRATVRAKAR